MYGLSRGRVWIVAGEEGEGADVEGDEAIGRLDRAQVGISTVGFRRGGCGGGGDRLRSGAS